MRVIVWQWGRRGAGPRLAAALADGLDAIEGVEAVLSLSTDAEILREPGGPRCDFPVQTYTGLVGLLGRLAQAPLMVMRLSRRLRHFAPAFAVCAMPGPLDLLMLGALHSIGVRAAVIVHDAELHPGDRFPLFKTWQRMLIRRADLVIVLSKHVASGLKANGSLRPGTPILFATLPALPFGDVAPAGKHAGPRRLLCFGRLRAYKGLDLLADALHALGPRADLELRVVGQGPETEALATLRALPCVSVENRWVADSEIGTLLGWSDIVVLPYREASQSAIAPMALAAGRRVIATRVGGLPQQLEAEPLATLCEPDPASLATALAGALDMPASDHAPVEDPRFAWHMLAETVLNEMRAMQP